MKKKRNSRFKVKDFIAVLVSLSLCAFWIFLFIRDINREEKKENEQSIAIVTNQENNAERKFVNRTVWTRIKTQTQLYNGDYIRIEPNASSEIEFADGTKVSIAENSLVQIFIDEDGNYATLSNGGGIVVDSTKGSSKFFMITEQGKKVNIETGSVISVESSSEKIDVTVQKGRASYTDKDGVESFATNGSGLVINEDETTERKMIVVLNPVQNSKLMNSTDGDYGVQFSWSKNNSFIKNVKIEIARDADFKIEPREYIRSADSAETFIELPNGIYYWRLTAQNEKGSDLSKSVQSGKFHIFDGTKPKLISPSFDEKIFRSQNDLPVSFKWEQKYFAEFYEITIAKNPELTMPVINQNVFDGNVQYNLQEGTYYWSVRTFYGFNNYGFGKSSNVSKFEIKTKEELSAPVVFAPESNSVFYRPRKFSKPKTAAGENIYFSWKNENRFSEYDFTLAKDKDFASIIKQEKLKDNFYFIPISDLSEDITYYWKISAKTVNGKTTKDSNVFTFVIDSNKVLEEKLLYPPDGIHFSEDEIKASQFLWKMNEAEFYIFEICKDKNFSSPEIQKETEVESVTDIALPPGVWYWRVLDGNEKERATKTGVFVVDEPPHIPLPVELVTPKDKIVFKGETVLKTPVEFEWQSNEKIKSAVFVLKKKNGKGQFENFITRNSLSKTQSVVRLTSGSYIWKINATASDGTDISSSERSFEVLQPARLPAPVLLKPEQKTIFDTEYLKTNSNILFKWQKVPDATGYLFLIQKKDGNNFSTIVKKSFSSGVQSYLLDDISLLSNGNFVWSVTAENRADDGFLIQSGNPASNEFSIQVQLPGKIQIKDVGAQYGE